MILKEMFDWGLIIALVVLVSPLAFMLIVFICKGFVKLISYIIYKWLEFCEAVMGILRGF